MGDLTNYMIKSVVKSGPDATIKEAAEKMKKERVTSLVVLEGDRPVGIITEADLTRRAIVGGHDLNTVKVRELMTTSLITIELESTVQDANDIMRKSGIRHLPVMEGGKIVGLITMLGLLRFYMDLSKTHKND